MKTKIRNEARQQSLPLFDESIEEHSSPSAARYPDETGAILGDTDSLGRSVHSQIRR